MASQNGLNNAVVDNDFTVTNTECGGDAIVSVENLCADPNSHAVIEATADSAGGDSFIDFIIDGGAEWVEGIDNSVTSPQADPFVLSASANLGTTNVMVAQTTGELNYPLQPSFLVATTGENNVTGDDTLITIHFDTETYDIGSNFSTGAYTFTAPITGKYYLSMAIGLRANGTAYDKALGYIVTSNQTFEVFHSQTAGQHGDISCVYSVICDMDKDDTAYIQFKVNGPAKTVGYFGGQASWFSGSLIT